MEILRAPLTEEEYRTYPVPPLPPDFTGDKYVCFANDCWSWMENRVCQPLAAVCQTHIYPVPSRYAGTSSEGYLVIAPKHLPVLRAEAVSWRNSYFADWQPAPNYDVLDDTVRVYGAPCSGGGIVRLEYVSGYDPIPEDLRLLFALFVSHKTSAMAFDAQAGTAVLPQWLPKDVLAGIDHYKRVR